jgi:hypothetical protein
MSRVEQALAEFKDGAVTLKLLRALYGAIPGSPAFQPLVSMEEIVRAIEPSANVGQISVARNFADTTEAYHDTLWMANLMDSGDKCYAVMTGLSAAWKLLRGQGAASFENDTQQRNDAVLKGLGIAYMIYKAYPGSLTEKAAAFRSSAAGQAIAIYYGAVEVALPFADNAVTLGSGGLSSMLNTQAGAQAQRLAQMAQGHEVGHAQEMLGQVTSQLQAVTAQAANYIQPMTQALAPYLPGATTIGNTTDKAAGAIAAGADILPVYRYLAARLVAESAALRALGR